MNYARSDLACEEMPRGDTGEGTEMSERHVGAFRILRMRICTEEAERRLGRVRGSYVTFECGRLERLGEQNVRMLAHLLAGELRGMAKRVTGRAVDARFGVFVAGLGNAELTADAIGPGTVRRLTATRHLREHAEGLYREAGCAALSALAPGVLGQTGIETVEILRGTVRAVRPDLVLVIDSLAARSCARLASTVQISDTGIAPGSGVGNHRAAINAESMGVPVIAVGVPTVVHTATLVYDALSCAGIDPEAGELRRVLEEGNGFFVSPKESDLISASVSELLAQAIDCAFVGALAE